MKLIEHEEFDKRFFAALKAAYKEYTKRSFVEWGTDFVDVALGVYEELRVDRLALLARRGGGTEAEKRELEAIDQAIAAYSIVRYSETMEGLFGVTQQVWKERISRRTDKERAVEAITQSFEYMDQLADLCREAKRLLSDLGLPTTGKGLMDVDYRIQIDLESCKLGSADYVTSLCARLEHIQSHEPDPSDAFQ